MPNRRNSLPSLVPNYNAYAVQKTLVDYLLRLSYIEPEQEDWQLLTDQTLVFYTNEDVARFNARRLLGAYNCNFLFDASVTERVETKVCMNCRFLISGTYKPRYTHYCHGEPEVKQLFYTKLMVISRTTDDPLKWCHGILNTTNGLMYFNGEVHNHRIEWYDSILKENYTNALNSAVDAYYVRYKERLSSFSTSSFVAGVELEIPVSFESSRVSRYNKRKWFCSSDASLICGNTEMVSRPVSLRHLRSSAFVEHVRELYSALQTPPELSKYVDYTSESDNGAGVHIHISWHSNNALSAKEVRKFYYRILHQRGGQVYALAKGGKSYSCFKSYSPYKPEAECLDKYDCVHVISDNHLELRWLANDPEPEIVHERLKLAIDIFEQAVLECLKYNISKSTVLNTCRILPSLLTTYSRLSPEQQQTAPPTLPTPASYDPARAATPSSLVSCRSLFSPVSLPLLTHLLQLVL